MIMAAMSQLRPPTKAAFTTRELSMADSDPPNPPVKSSGCGFAIGVLFFFALTLVALLSTYITSQLTRPSDATGFAVVTLILWALWVGVLVLLVRALRKAN